MQKLTIVAKNTSLIGKTFTAIHLAMVKNRTPLQVTYPDYSEENRFIGTKLTILGSKKDLEELNLKTNKIFSVTSIKEALPSDYEFSFKRKHEKINNSKIRRSIKRARERGEDIDENQYREEMRRKALSLPYLSIPSSSTGQHFKLFVERVPFKAIMPDFYGMIK